MNAINTQYLPKTLHISDSDTDMSEKWQETHSPFPFHKSFQKTLLFKI